MEPCSPLRKECCANTENLERFSTHKKDLVVDVCKVCQRRHFELTVDPGEFVMTLGQ